MIHHVHAPLPKPFSATITAPEIGKGLPLPVTVLGVSCYPGCLVTFWVRGEGGWLYCDVPPHWLGGGKAKHACPKLHTGFTVDVPMVPEITYNELTWSVVALLDFMDANELFWVLRRNGEVEVKPHRCFDATPPEGGLRKLRASWTVQG